jgi:hypothetical protein
MATSNAPIHSVQLFGSAPWCMHNTRSLPSCVGALALQSGSQMLCAMGPYGPRTPSPTHLGQVVNTPLLECSPV